MVGRMQQLAARATGQSNKNVPVSSFASNTMRSFACLYKLIKLECVQSRWNSTFRRASARPLLCRSAGESMTI